MAPTTKTPAKVPADFRSHYGTNLLSAKATSCDRLNKDLMEGGSPAAVLLKVANLPTGERPALLLYLSEGGLKLMVLHGISRYIPSL